MIDLSKYTDVKNRVTGVGIELEGAWTKAPRGVEVVRDGSLDVWKQPADGVLKGEIPSPVLTVGKQVEDWLKAHYPAYCNHERCGMHIHLSVGDNFRYQQLMAPEYMETVLHYLTSWATKEDFGPFHWIWDRLAGRVQYCKKVFDADAQVRARVKSFDHDIPGNRYTAVNYPWARFRTVECRVLPMMNDADQATRAVNELVDITNKFLNATAKTEKALKTTIELDGSPDVRESVILI